MTENAVTRQARFVVVNGEGREVQGTEEFASEEFASADLSSAQDWLIEYAVSYAHEHVEEIARAAGEDEDDAFGLWDPMEYVSFSEIPVPGVPGIEIYR